MSALKPQRFFSSEFTATNLQRGPFFWVKFKEVLGVLDNLVRADVAFVEEITIKQRFRCYCSRKESGTFAKVI